MPGLSDRHFQLFWQTWAGRFRILLKSELRCSIPMLKATPKKGFNGTRLSPHIFNTASEVDKAVAAIRKELSQAFSEAASRKCPATCRRPIASW
jgi:selenocysteine lyase/cysteine desulfurase